MIVRELIALMGVKTDTASFGAAQNMLTNLSGKIAGVLTGLIAIGTAVYLKHIVDETSKAADELDELSVRLGTATGELQKLGFVANISGVDMSSLEGALRKLQINMVSASEGGKDNSKNFRKLGIDIKNSKGDVKNFSEILPEVADGLSKLKTQAEKTTMAQELFGRAGTRLLPMLSEGKEAVAKLMTEFEELGGVTSENLIYLSTVYQDNLVKIDIISDSIKDTITEKLLPSFIFIQQATIDWWKINREWIAQHLEVVFTRIGSVLKNVAAFMYNAVNALTEWGKGLTPLQKKIAGITLAVMALAGILMLPGGALVLIIALILLIIEDFQVWKDGGDSLIGHWIGSYDKYAKKIKEIGDGFTWLWNLWSDWITKNTETFSAFMLFIEDCLSGNILKAFENFGARIGEIWGPVFDGIKEFITNTVRLITYEVGEIFPGVTKSISEWFLNLVQIAHNWAIDFAKPLLSPFEKLIKFFTGKDINLTAAAQSFTDKAYGTGGHAVKMDKIEDKAGGSILQMRTISDLMSGKGMPANITARPGIVGGGAFNNTNQVSVDVNISGQVDAKALTGMIGKGITDAIDKQNREAMSTLRPQQG